MGVSSHMEEGLGIVVRYLHHMFCYVVLTFKNMQMFSMLKNHSK